MINFRKTILAALFLAVSLFTVSVPVRAQEESKGSVYAYTVSPNTSSFTNFALIGGGNCAVPSTAVGSAITFTLPGEATNETITAVVTGYTPLYTYRYYSQYVPPQPIFAGYMLAISGTEPDGEKFTGTLVVNEAYYLTKTYRSYYYHFYLSGGSLTLTF